MTDMFTGFIIGFVSASVLCAIEMLHMHAVMERQRLVLDAYRGRVRDDGDDE